MKDRDCVEFLQWSLPRLRMRWQGFRKVRGQVCKRIDRRLRELGLPDVAAYRAFLETNDGEWTTLDSLCNITISRFYRDREVFQFLEQEVLVTLSENALARGEGVLRCWSIGCASGEEPYTLALLWDLVMTRRFPALSLTILATDRDPLMIRRAEEGRYKSGSFVGLPAELRKLAFFRKGDLYYIGDEARRKVAFLVQDIRKAAPEDRFHLVLCRNLAFTYFEPPLQQEVLTRVSERLFPNGAFVTGSHESLPAGSCGFKPWPGGKGIYRKEVKEGEAGA
ncbi:MAG TPA: CheR family methyltransferase [Nitrospirota bacterium]|nr:CheR family methyltransferase [Nitrospirota bacterium]